MNNFNGFPFERLYQIILDNITENVFCFINVKFALTFFNKQQLEIAHEHAIWYLKIIDANIVHCDLKIMYYLLLQYICLKRNILKQKNAGELS